MTQTIELRVPDIGDFHDVPIIEIPVAVGDVIAADDTVIVLESDKATLDVPAETGGRIAEIRVKPGDNVSKGTVIAMIEATAAQPDDVPAATISAPVSAPAAKADNTPPVPPVASNGGPFAHASPSVRKLAREMGVTIGDVAPTGPHGRITPDDLKAHVKARLARTGPVGTGISQNLPPWPKVDFRAFGPIERKPLGRLRKISGPGLARNAMVIPHVTNFDEADVTETEKFRKAANAEAPDVAHLTMLAFAIKASVSALMAYPEFNSSLDGDEIVMKKYYHIGVAADTPDGLVVPVIRDADRKSLREIAMEMSELAAQARVGRLPAQAMQGSTFTVSSLGGIGGTNFTPIINAPDVAILGMTRAGIQPKWDGASFQPRLIQPLSLSWDHRVVDGVAAARFLVHLRDVLSDFRRISL
ncbi:2-oxo acid dehydrogenase subunit E2 [Roseinatronobacter sp. S2]|uniref:2-oxo acid dehydrogenase subunit E2 n=1 Tax=Roseinatronobacter sp. S2 TaxID=3035471 RepID=UPI00240EE48E|nr:2-oxo acid dehydrogenase subunit E2 [Roseinatronobacter sp. S2]WFE76977.1 2-oxo acid dehydrogenase subunit E2 [Roseinatronobacter sp. S2]